MNEKQTCGEVEVVKVTGFALFDGHHIDREDHRRVDFVAVNQIPVTHQGIVVSSGVGWV